MTISFDVPLEVEQQLRVVLGDPGQAAKEALAVQGYQQRKFGISTVRRLLNLQTSWEAEQWLAKQGIPQNYNTADLEADSQTLKSLLDGKSK
jgi:predicted HTH domain antitoxin